MKHLKSFKIFESIFDKFKKEDFSIAFEDILDKFGGNVDFELKKDNDNEISAEFFDSENPGKDPKHIRAFIDKNDWQINSNLGDMDLKVADVETDKGRNRVILKISRNSE